MGKSKELAELGDVVTQSGGNVGVGTQSPYDALHVMGTIRSEVTNSGDENLRLTTTGGGGLVVEPDDPTTANPSWEIRTFSNEPLNLQVGGATRLGIDASGRVTMPYQPHISGTPNNSGGNGIANAFYTYQAPVGLSFSNSRITVPIAGNYMICWNTIGDSGVGRVDTFIRVNGSIITNGMGDSNHTDYRYRGNAVVVRLAANDYIQFEHQDYYYPALTSFNDWNHASVTFLG